MSVIDELWRGIQTVRMAARTPQDDARAIQAGRRLYTQIIDDGLRRGSISPTYGPPGGGLPVEALFGLEVVVDRHLPAEVWRLTERDGSLLFDCRQGKVWHG